MSQRSAQDPPDPPERPLVLVPIRSSSNVPHIMGFSRNEGQIVGGFAEEFVRRLAKGGRAEVSRSQAMP